MSELAKVQVHKALLAGDIATLNKLLTDQTELCADLIFFRVALDRIRQLPPPDYTMELKEEPTGVQVANSYFKGREFVA
jgi:hypothetical protein